MDQHPHSQPDADLPTRTAAPDASAVASAAGNGRLSYKFQRLREKLRQAILKGELTGKLPGERELAKRFHANAKTLSKALTDLAAEGLLDRSIGRGTYVKGSKPQVAREDRWMILCPPGQADAPLARRLREANAEAQVVTDDVATLRPSFVSQFRAVIDLSPRTPEAFVRDLIVRAIPVVTVGRDPTSYATHVVMMDRVHALSCLARDLVLAGHRHLAVVERQGSALICEALRTAARRYAPDVEVDSCYAEDATTMVQHGVTAIVCESPESGRMVREAFATSGVDVPGRVTLAAVGCLPGSLRDAPCSGFYVTVEQKAGAILDLLRDKPPRPAALWLTGQYAEEGTLGSGDARPLPMAMPLPMLASA